MLTGYDSDMVKDTAKINPINYFTLSGKQSNGGDRQSTLILNPMAAIALSIKTASNWTWEECGKPYPPLYSDG
ncbi:MAG: hypothetical protein F6J99_32625 [Moorea sp. SIO4G3]|nr:hypothetical protein [Moorena sp. SIO4G3]